MYKLTNIAAEVGRGFMYHGHDSLRSPSSSLLSIEPHIGAIQLKLNESYTISDDQFEKNRRYFEELINNRIIEAKQISIDTKEVLIKAEPPKKIITQVIDISEKEPEVVEEVAKEAEETPEDASNEDKDLQLHVTLQKPKKKGR